VGGRDQERFDLLRQIATSYLDRAEPHWKQIGLQVLIEADARHPGVFDADLEEARSMAPEAAADTAAAREAAESMGSPPKILVLGGDEHQDRREDDLSGLEPELGIEAEWIETDYVRPDRILEKLGEQLTTHPPDGLLILHWNRNELVRDVRKLCRTHRVSTRFCYFAGTSALEAGLADLVNAVSQRRGEAAGA